MFCRLPSHQLFQLRDQFIGQPPVRLGIGVTIRVLFSETLYLPQRQVMGLTVGLGKFFHLLPDIVGKSVDHETIGPNDDRLRVRLAQLMEKSINTGPPRIRLPIVNLNVLILSIVLFPPSVNRPRSYATPSDTRRQKKPPGLFP